MRKKKKGSTLVFVIAIFFMLITFGTAILTATTIGYRNQITENKRTQNLYESEAGIDVTYNIIGKAIEAAIFASNMAVETTLQGKTGITGKIEKERENVRQWIASGKPESWSFLYPDPDKTKGSRLYSDVNNKIVLNKDVLREVQEEIFNKNFDKFITLNLKTYVDEAKYIANIKEEYLVTPVDDNGDLLYLGYKTNTTTRTAVFDEFNYGTTKPSIEATVEEKSESVATRTKIPVSVKSKFYTGLSTEDDYGSGVGKQERVITVLYNIEIPSYNPTNSIKKVEIIQVPLFDYSFAAEENIYLAGDLTIEGNLYSKGNNNKTSSNESIQGSNTTNDSVVFDKYNGGITIESISGKENTKIDIKGDMVTTENISLRDNTSLNMEGNIYASNLHLGKYKDFYNVDSGENVYINKGLQTSGNNLNVYLKNDLSIYANNSEVNIAKFYGLNDISGNTVNSITDNTKKSSSILINSTKGVNVNIISEAYILGTAYINTAGGYQTGESVAIKGNYNAYSNSLEGEAIDGDTSKTYTNLKFVYDKPLQLVVSMDKDGNEVDLNVIDKAKYFSDYYSKDDQSLEKNVSVSLPSNTVSVGAYVNTIGNQVEVKGTSGELGDAIVGDVKNLHKEFANKVYGFNSTNMTESDFYSPDLTKIKSISTELSLDKLPYYNTQNDTTESGFAYNYDVIFNNDNTKNIVLIGNGISNTEYNAFKSDTNNIVYDCRSGADSGMGFFEGLILTAGDVTIYGKLDYTGSIIAGGSIVCNKDEMKKNFTHDSEVVKNIVAINYDKLYKAGNSDESVIKNPTEYSKHIVELEMDSSKLHNVKDYISQGVWSIEK